jgi:flagellar protein FlaG
MSVNAISSSDSPVDILKSQVSDVDKKNAKSEKIPTDFEKINIENRIYLEKNSKSLRQQREYLSSVVDKLNELLRDGGRSVSFNVDQDSGESVIVVTNLDTGKVIRQIPSQTVIDLAQDFEKLKGLIHNKCA